VSELLSICKNMDVVVITWKYWYTLFNYGINIKSSYILYHKTLVIIKSLKYIYIISILGILYAFTVIFIYR